MSEAKPFCISKKEVWEAWSGADFAITAEVSRGVLRVTEAILAQAKLGELADLVVAERGRLVAQIQEMRRLT